jgi:hypothetical protein
MTDLNDYGPSSGIFSLPIASARSERTLGPAECYIVFTTSQHGNHSHIIVTHDPCFETPEKRFDQIGPSSIGPKSDRTEVNQLVTQEIVQWIAEPANASYLSRSANPVAVFHDTRAVDLAIVSWVPQSVVKCILDNTKVFAKVYELDPLAAARFCK